MKWAQISGGMSLQSAACILIIIEYFSFYCSTHDFKMPDTSVQDSETTKKCSNDFNLLFESIPRFNKDIKEGPIYSIRRVWNALIDDRCRPLVTIQSWGIKTHKKCFCQGSLSVCTVLYEVTYSSIPAGRAWVKWSL